jgi:hypothetical protein
MLTSLRRSLWVARDGIRNALLGTAHRRAIFSRIHTHNLWKEPESASGTGSSLAATDAVRAALPELVRRVGARTLLDAPCGDFAWMRTIVGTFDRYHGVDIVPALVEANRARYASETVTFACADLTTDPLPASDLVLCRDCFIHLPTSSIQAAIANFRRSARWLLATTCPGVPYQNVAVGSFRPVDLEAPPFKLGTPIDRIVEAPGRELALWRIG